MLFGIFGMRSGQKLTIEAVQQEFAAAGCVLLELDYSNNNQKLRFKCGCGNKGEKTLVHFRRGAHCKACGYKNTGLKNGRLTLDDVRAVFADAGCTLLAIEYTSNAAKMPYMCKCGSLHEMSLANFKKGKRCPTCAGKTAWNYKSAAALYRSHGCELLADKYVGINTSMAYQCFCGAKSSTSLGNFLRGVRCMDCGIKKLSGANNRLYDSSKTPQERERRRQYTEYSEWRRKVYARDGHTCQCCGAKRVTLNAHHLESYASNRALRTEVDNGVTLCKPCHHQFHTRYGFFKPTTKQQYLEFIGEKNAELYS